MKKNNWIFILLITSILLLAACGAENNTDQASEEGKLNIYTTVYPLQDFAEKIGGEYVEVETVYPAGADEHTFEPTQKDIINIAESDIFFYIGHGLEGFAEKNAPILTDEGVSVVAVGEMVQLDENIEDATHEESEHAEEDAAHDEHGEEEHQHGTVDPHLWIDPVYAEQLARIITDSLNEAMPEQKDYFEANYEAVKEKLNELDEQFTNLAANPKHSEFLVSHAAYGYWEQRYGLQQLSVAGLSTSQEPSQKELTEIIEEVEANNLKYILVEQNTSIELVSIIQDEAGISALPIHNLSTLTEENMENGDDYFSIMEANLESLNQALNN